MKNCLAIFKKAIFIIILINIIINPVRAEYWCKALALRDTHYNEDVRTRIKKGATVQFSSHFGDNLCQHGGYCAKRYDFRLIDCDNHLRPIRTRNNAQAARFSDVEDTLIGLGLCTACASNATAWYIHLPSSRTGKQVKAALEGNPFAIQQLRANVPQYQP